MSEAINNKVQYKKNYSFLENIKYILGKIWMWQKSFVFFTIIYSLMIVVNQYVPVLLPKYVIDSILEDKYMYHLVLIITFFIFIKIVSGEICDWGEKQSLWRLQDIKMKLAELRLNKSLTLDYYNLEDQLVLGYMEKAKRSCIEEVQTIVGINSTPMVDEDTVGIMGIVKNFIILLVNIFSLIWSGMVIIILNPFIVIVMFLLAFCSFKILIKAKERDVNEFWEKIAINWRKVNYINSVIRNSGYAKDIRLYDLSEWLNEKQQLVNDETHLMYKQHYYRWIKCAALMQIFITIQEVVLYGWLIYQVIFRNMAIGNFFMYFGFTRMFFSCAMSIFDVLATMNRQSIETNDYRTFIEYPDSSKDNNEIATNNLELESLHKYEFIFENVSFKYPGQHEYILKDLNFVISSEKKQAIVGLNGAGKTTLIKVLMRLYEPSEGRILLNGIDIRSYTKESYYKIFSPVFQNVECYAFNLAQNVSMKELNKTDYELVSRELDTMGLADKYMNMSKGINTEITRILHNDGIELSGGEKQKVGLARALYKNAPVVLLDEPTSALDPISEYEMYMKLNEMFKLKTMIFISHRLSSTRFCDSIILLFNGRIVEEGTHEYLLNKNGMYTELFNKQAFYYKEELGKNESFNEFDAKNEFCY